MISAVADATVRRPGAAGGRGGKGVGRTRAAASRTGLGDVALAVREPAGGLCALVDVDAGVAGAAAVISAVADAAVGRAVAARGRRCVKVIRARGARSQA